MFQEILQGGNSGGGSTETVTPLISSKVLGNTGDSITLSDDMTKYKYIDFVVSYNEISNGNYQSHRTANRIPLYLIQKCLDDISTNGVKAYNGSIVVETFSNLSYTIFFGLQIVGNNSIKVMLKTTTGWNANQCYIEEINGIN